jgi:glycosyltransferase involved in cell wall biosynthesis
MESFGLAALEAMACSVPTIATRVGGVPELIHDTPSPADPNAPNGLLFPVGDVEAMAIAAIALLNDPPRLEAMAAAARRTAQDRFCTTRIIPLYEQYYERVLTRSQSQAGE